MIQKDTCPLIEDFWEKRADEEAYDQKRQQKDRSRVHVSDRRQERLERRNYPQAILISHPQLGEITVPSIQVIPLHQLSYLKIVRKIIDANPTKMFTRLLLQEIWEAILDNVYAYENKGYDLREEKKTEVRIRSKHECMFLTLATVLGFR